MRTALSDCTAAILAGGLGTRLRPVVPDLPKVLASVCGRTFITYILDQLVTAGVRSVVLCVGYMADSVRGALGDRYASMVLTYSQEADPLGTGGALRLALPYLESRTVLVLNGDSYCETSLVQFGQWHFARARKASLLLTSVEDTRRYGSVEIDDDCRIVRFVEKAAAAGPGLINAGVYLLDKDWLASIPVGMAVSLEREVFPSWIERGMLGFLVRDRLWDIGVPDAYLEAGRSFAPRINR